MEIASSKTVESITLDTLISEILKLMYWNRSGRDHKLCAHMSVNSTNNRIFDVLAYYLDITKMNGQVKLSLILT